MKSTGGIWSLRGEGEDTRTCLMRGGVMLFCCLDLEVEPWWYSCGSEKARLKTIGFYTERPACDKRWVGGKGGV